MEETVENRVTQLERVVAGLRREMLVDSEINRNVREDANRHNDLFLGMFERRFSFVDEVLRNMALQQSGDSQKLRTVEITMGGIHNLVWTALERLQALESSVNEILRLFRERGTP